MRKISISLTTTIIVIAAIVLSAAQASLSFTFSNSNVLYKLFHAFAQTQSQKNTALSLSNLISENQPYQGSAIAPITVIDFSDLQCLLCGRFVKDTEPQINSTYVQTGKVALVFEHLPNRGFDSLSAALAAQCTNDQGKFWQYHNLLYKDQGPIDSGWASKDNLKKFASEIPGLDMAKFNSCFDSQRYKLFIEANLSLAHSLGFTQTPSFIIIKSDGSNQILNNY